MGMSIGIVCRDNHAEGFSEPLFASFDGEKCEEWIRKTVDLANLETHGLLGYKVSDYQITYLSLDTPKELRAHNEFDPPGSVLNRRLVFTWHDAR